MERLVSAVSLQRCILVIYDGRAGRFDGSSKEAVEFCLKTLCGNEAGLQSHVVGPAL
jgi:hypothetical protein